MSEEKKLKTKPGEVKKADNKDTSKKAANTVAKSVYGAKKKQERAKGRRNSNRDEKQDEFEQVIVDLARVTRVMAGGKRMRFRACVAIGNKKGKVGVGIAKGADVTIAINKAVNKAKKNTVDVSIVNDTIPHEIYHKKGAGKILLKPARRGKGVIAGGAIRMLLELSGVKNVTSKNLGTSNKVTVVKCALEALDTLKKVEVKKAPATKKAKGTEKKFEKKEVKKTEKAKKEVKKTK